MSLPNFIIKIPIVSLFTLHITKNIAYHITEVLIFYADKLMVMGNSKKSRVFNFAILLKSLNSTLAKYTCFTVAINTEHGNEHAGNCLSYVCLAEYVSSSDPHVDRDATG